MLGAAALNALSEWWITGPFGWRAPIRLPRARVRTTVRRVRVECSRT